MKYLGKEGTVPVRVFAQHLAPMIHQGAPQGAVRVACTRNRFRGATKGSQGTATDELTQLHKVIQNQESPSSKSSNIPLL